MNVYCQHCDGEFIAVFQIENGKPLPLDLDTCPYCGQQTRIEYAPDRRPDAKEFMHSGEIVTARTPYAFEWWRHNKEFFVTLRYKPRRVT